jgi:RNA polymerase sigma factor (sigma-70 family)
MSIQSALWSRPYRAPRRAPRFWWAWLSRADPRADSASRAERLPLRLLRRRSDDNPSPTTLTELYHAYRLPMVRLAILLVDDLHTAEDVVQDAFTAVCRRHGANLRGIDDAGAYLNTAVVNAARSVLRRRRTARAYVPPRQEYGPPIDEHVLLKEEHRAVFDALQHLTRRQREVLVLRYWSNLSEIEIADALKLSRGAVKSTASRALDTLEKLLETR